MKSTAITAAILASIAVAQPHGHHRRHRHEDQLEKRALVIEWETVWETATVFVDEYTTETVLPSKTAEPEPTTSTGEPIQFYETPTTLATSTTAPTVEEVPVPTTTEVPPAPTTTYAPEPEPEPTTADQPTTVEQPPVVEQPTVEEPPVVETPTSVAPPPPPPPAEKTTSTPPAAQPTPVSPPESDSSKGSGGSSGGYGGGEGDITYFNVALGACGYDDTGADDTENIVALPAGMWDAESTLTSYGINMPAHPWCDKTITIQAPNGKTCVAKVRDRCPGCDGASIDVTPHAFKELYGSLEAGRTEAKWWFNN